MTDDERARVEAALADREICLRCGATLETFAEQCAADLAEPCEGFLRIENAKLGVVDGRRVVIGEPIGGCAG